jgi:virulence-associated protein VapD
MYAIAFDLVVADTELHHPSGVSQAYAEIGFILAEYGFRRVQGSLYVTDDENMAQLFVAIQTLKSQSWFPLSVRDIRAFRIEQWSDFTPVVKDTRA